MTDKLLYLPVSLGEAIDKLTILDIKMDKIMDDRINDVKIEYDLLYDKLKEFIIKYENLYKTMRKVNLIIWDMMDLLRDGDLNESQYLKVCKECIEYNDIRFRVKNKINYVSLSLLKEQKSYKINRLLIIVNKDINELSLFVKYFSFIYDEINIVSNLNLDSLKETFHYDTTILFKSIQNSINTDIDYKTKIVVDYDETDIYKLFNISAEEIQKLI